MGACLRSVCVPAKPPTREAHEVLAASLITLVRTSRRERRALDPVNWGCKVLGMEVWHRAAIHQD